MLIALRLGTTEQVIKNYLRSVYDKTGVSDRLELALFTIHHRILANLGMEDSLYGGFALWRIHFMEDSLYSRYSP